METVLRFTSIPSIPSERDRLAYYKMRREVLYVLGELAWNDPETFFSLLANCISVSPVEIREGPRRKLLKLKLINENGVSPFMVRNIAREIARDISDNLKLKNVC